MKKNYSTNNADQSGIPPITKELSNDRTSSFTVVEHRRTAKEVKLSALRAKKNAKRKTFEIEKMHLWNEEIEAQYRVKLAELEISSKKKIDLLETQNAKNIEINLSSPIILMNVKTVFQEIFSQNNQIICNSTEVNRSQVDGINQ